MLFEYFIQVEHWKLSIPKAATILAHSFYYGKTMWHSPGKSLSGYQFILHEGTFYRVNNNYCAK